MNCFFLFCSFRTLTKILFIKGSEILLDLTEKKPSKLAAHVKVDEKNEWIFL